jgi:predicted nucleic acid-binding protein
LVVAGENYFWDSCVFIAFLNNQTDAYDIESIERFLEDSKKNNGCKIYTSSIALAEVTPKRLMGSSYGTFEEFLSDFRKSVAVIDAGPFINSTAGRLKDVIYKKSTSTKRILTTGDAIMLATALELEDTYGVKIDAFHTFDDGRGKGNPEGKGIPILSYHEWCEGVEDNELVKRVIDMNRCKPIAEEPRFI